MSAASSEKPNILFIFSDQQRWDSVSCYENPIYPGLTPNLDDMASRGVRFDRAFTPQPVCGPARSCIQTGRWATETGCFTNGIALPTEERTIAHMLSESGYSVNYIGKWHLASNRREGINYRSRPIPPELRGGYRDYWLASDVLEFTSHAYDGHMFDGGMNTVEFPENRYRVDCLTDFALERIRDLVGGDPFFLFLSYIEPHHQNDHSRFEGPIGSRERYGDFEPPGDLEGANGDWDREMPDYLGAINSLDSSVGRLRSELQDLGISDSTLVIYTSDHGCHFRTRNLEYKRSCHDSSIRVPMVMLGPDFGGGRVVEDLVSLLDLPPTILRAAGVDRPAQMRGYPLQDVMDSPTDWREEIFTQISESQVGRAIRTRRWKYSVRDPEKNGSKHRYSRSYVEDFLYDLDSDPHESNNLVDDPEYSDIRSRLGAVLSRRCVEAGEVKPKITRRV